MKIAQIIFSLTRTLSLITGGMIRLASSTPKNTLTHGLYLYNGSYLPWEEDLTFLAFFKEIKTCTLKDIARCYELYQLACQVATSSTPGCFLEVGAWRGGSAALLARALRQTESQRELFVFDTFEGIVKTSSEDNKFRDKDLSDTNEEIATDTISKAEYPSYRVLKGTYPDDLNSEMDPLLGAIALLHCDVDTYQSTEDIVQHASPRMHSGSIIVFDDYGLPGCEGVTRFVDKLSSEQFIKIYNGNAHAVVIKR